MQQKNNQSKGFLAKWGLLFVISGSILIMILDSTLMNVSISDLVKDLNTDVKTIQWMITIYSLVMASLMITGGRLGDLWGRKKTFLAGVILYGIGTITAALSPNSTVLLLGWSIIEGVAAALMMPATLSLLLDNYHGSDRKIAFGAWGGIASASAAAGPILGGFMTSNYSWRWAFGIEAVIVVLILAFSFLIKSHHESKQTKVGLDIRGVILSVLGLGTLLYGVIESSTYGWWKAKELYSIGSWQFDFLGMSITPFFMLIGLIILIFFVLRERGIEKRGEEPLISMSLFKDRHFSSGMITLACLGLMLAGVILAIPLFLQLVRGLDAYDTGIALLPMSLAIFFTSIAGAKLSSKFPAKYIIQAGILISTASIFLIADQVKVDASKSDLALGLGVLGLGLGLIMAQISSVSLSSLKRKHFGEGSGIMTTLRTFGGALGTAIIGTIFISSLITNLENKVNDSQVIPEQMKTEFTEQIKEASSSLGQQEESDQDLSQVPEEITTEVVNIKNESGVSATKDSLYYSLIFAGLTLAISFWLPKQGKELSLEELE